MDYELIWWVATAIICAIVFVLLMVKAKSESYRYLEWDGEWR